MKSKILLAASILLAATTQAQDLTTPQPDNWHIGVGGGLHSSFLQYSDLNEDIYPSKKLSNGGVFSIFAQGEFGNKHQFAIRPELNYTLRGGKLTDIGSKFFDEASGMSFYELNELKDIRYSLSAHCERAYRQPRHSRFQHETIQRPSKGRSKLSHQTRCFSLQTDLRRLWHEPPPHGQRHRGRKKPEPPR